MLISIITINYNNLEGLQKTMKSVLDQTYANIEYIVIDGASTDGSSAYIQDRDKFINYWISENDYGIYDAMNKGIEKATGDYVLFLNSGDWFADVTVVENFVEQKPREDIVYGDAILNYRHKKVRKYMPKTLEGIILLNHTITHQTIFHKINIFKYKKYDLKYTLIADWVFYSELILLNKGTYRHLDLIVANFDMAGESTNHQNQIKIKKEREFFYLAHSKFFIPLLIQQNEACIKIYSNLQRPKLVKWAIKISRKLNLIS